jgi:GTPase SAR1 family protein
MSSDWSEEKTDIVLKILLIGDSGTGKSSILLRFTGLFDFLDHDLD